MCCRLHGTKWKTRKAKDMVITHLIVGDRNMDVCLRRFTVYLMHAAICCLIGRILGVLGIIQLLNYDFSKSLYRSQIHF